MNLEKKINELKPSMLNCNVFSVYDYPSSYTITELLCEFFKSINECIKVCNKTIDLVSWLVSEGLKIEVAKKLQQWLEDGTLANIINKTLFKELNDKIKNVSDKVDILNLDKVNVKSFGAKGDSVNDDTESIFKAIDFAITSGIRHVFFPFGVYKINKTITCSTSIILSGSGCGESLLGSSVILKDGSFEGIQVYSRDVVLKNIIVRGDRDIDKCDGIVIGGTGSDRNAQGCILDNVGAINCGKNGITLKQCNNGKFDKIVTLYNNANGFSMEQTIDANYSGNIINIINSFGNGKNGVVVSGEGNRVYACSQSNNDDNIRIDGWCNNCDITAYTEYAVHGYEINVTGNGFGNNIKGTYRSKNNRVYKSVTGMVNHINFIQDVQNGDKNCVDIANHQVAERFYFLKTLSENPFTSWGYLEYDNGFSFNDNESSHKLAYTSHEKFNFNGIVATGEGTGGELLLNDTIGGFGSDVVIVEGGVINNISIMLDKEILSNILQIFVYKNNEEVGSSYNYLDNSSTTNVIRDLNVKVVKGDKISIKCVWFNNIQPRDIKIKVSLYKK